MIQEVETSALTQGYNPRKSLGDLNSLKNSIKQVGMLNPLLVRPLNGGYQIVAGHRRWMAAKEIGLAKVPCLIREISDEDAFHLAYVDNKERNNLNALEEAEHYSECCKKGMTVRDIAEVYNLSHATIIERYSLLALPKPIQDLVAQATIPVKHAYEISKMCNPTVLKKLFEDNKELIENWEEAYKKELEYRQIRQIDLANNVAATEMSVKTLIKNIKNIKEQLKQRDTKIVEIINNGEALNITQPNQVINKHYKIPSGIYEKIEKGILDIYDLKILLKKVTEQLLLRGEYQKIIDTEITPLLTKYEA